MLRPRESSQMRRRSSLNRLGQCRPTGASDDSASVGVVEVVSSARPIRQVSNCRSDFGSGKWTLSLRIVSSWMVAPKLRLEVFDAFLDDVLGRAGAGRDQDGLDVARTTHPGSRRRRRSSATGFPARWRSRRAGGCSSCSGCRAPAPDRPGPPGRERPPGGSGSRSRYRPWGDWRCWGTFSGGRRSRCWRRRR